MYRDCWGQVRTGTGLLVARTMMKRHLGRALTSDEVVHHIDGNPTNNEMANLQVMTRSEHMTLHSAGKVVPEEVRERISKTLMGHPGANLGKTFSEEHKRKIGEANSKSLRKYYERKRVLELSRQPE